MTSDTSATPALVWAAMINYGDFEADELLGIGATPDAAKRVCEEVDAAAESKTLHLSGGASGTVPRSRLAWEDLDSPHGFSSATTDQSVVANDLADSYFIEPHTLRG